MERTRLHELPFGTKFKLHLSDGQWHTVQGYGCLKRGKKRITAVDEKGRTFSLPYLTKCFIDE